MALRLLALLLLFAVLPTAELVEQSVHVTAHLLDVEVPDHDAHHDGAPGDEHGCTGLLHLCSCHQSLVTEPVAFTAYLTEQQLASLPTLLPRGLVDQRSPEPAQRPPIA